MHDCPKVPEQFVEALEKIFRPAIFKGGESHAELAYRMGQHSTVQWIRDHAMKKAHDFSSPDDVDHPERELGATTNIQGARIFNGN